MVTIEDFRNQNKDLTPYTDLQIDYLCRVLNEVKFPWECFEDGNVKIQTHPGAIGNVFVLTINDQCYMTTSPPDLLDHACLLIEASGNVLLTGLGLGVGVLLCNANRNVSSVTIIENNPVVIKHIVPMILNSCDRITPLIIEADANTWCSNHMFDYGFIDHGYQKVEHDRYHTYCKQIVSWWDARCEVEATWR